MWIDCEYGEVNFMSHSSSLGLTFSVPNLTSWEKQKIQCACITHQLVMEDYTFFLRERWNDEMGKLTNAWDMSFLITYAMPCSRAKTTGTDYVEGVL